MKTDEDFFLNLSHNNMILSVISINLSLINHVDLHADDGYIPDNGL